MSKLKGILVLLLLATWLPCTARCELEKTAVPDCGGTCKASQAGRHCPKSSAEHGCACGWTATGGYETSEDYIETEPALPLAIAPIIHTGMLLPRRCVLLDQLIVSRMPGDGWRFSSRAALPPRAPSFLL